MPRLLATSWMMAMVSSLRRRGGLMPLGNNIFGQVEHFVGNGISDEGFADEVFCFPNGFGGKRVVLGADADHFVGKQGRKLMPFCFSASDTMADRRGVAAGVRRVCLKAGNDVQFDLRPHGAEFAHCGHEPVETGVAFDCQPQLACFAFDDAGEVALGGGNLREEFACEPQQAFAGGREAQGRGFALKQRGVVIVFKRADLVRKGGLGQEDALGGKGYAAGFFECQQGFKMAQFDDGIHWFSRFQTTS